MLISIFITFIIPMAFLVVLGGWGYRTEQKHLADLDRREAQVGHLLTTNTAAMSHEITSVSLVIGNVVLGTDYLKQFMASLRTLVGGEMVSYQRVLDRARREAYLRMLEHAASKNARGVINVRFETADVTGTQASSELLCYGTMIA